MKEKQARKIIEQISAISKTDKEFFERMAAFHQLQQQKADEVWINDFVDRVMAENAPKKERK